MNTERIGMYHTIVRSPREVYEMTIGYPVSKETYLALRGMDLETLSDVERSARFLYLNRYCFNGLYRTNQSGAFNVPYAPGRSGSFPDWIAFKAASDQLSTAQIVNADFGALLQQHVRADDFVYLDPPFAVANRRIFRQYGPDTFGLEDLERLVDCLFCLEAVGAGFLVSYADSPEGRAAFRHWQTRRVYTYRNIAGFAFPS